MPRFFLLFLLSPILILGLLQPDHCVVARVPRGAHLAFCTATMSKQHAGQRLVPHAKGNRASHLHLPGKGQFSTTTIMHLFADTASLVTLDADATRQLDDLLSAVNAQLDEKKVAFERLTECHISLSKTLYVTSLTTQALVQAMGDAIQGTAPYAFHNGLDTILHLNESNQIHSHLG